jgi:hypothetical protein
MKHLRTTLCLVLAVCAVASLRAESYRVSVTRKDKDMYRIDRTKTYIKTKYCYEYVYSESAVLNYERGAYDNKLIFDKRPGPVTSCDVDKLLTED